MKERRGQGGKTTDRCSALRAVRDPWGERNVCILPQ